MSQTQSWPASMPDAPRHRLSGRAWLGACLLLFACATQPDVPRGSINIFFSPSGEPFRGEPSDPYPKDVWFNRADTNHDGALSEDEFVADAVSFFHKLDLNGDGVIDGAELSAYEQKTAPEILPRVVGISGERGQDEPRRLGPAISGAAFYSLLPEDEPVASDDTDFDGKITLAEAIAGARRRFAMLDRNHDGRIDRAELPKTPAERMMARSDSKRGDRGH